MKPRIAIPLPHSQRDEYNECALPFYKNAIAAAGGETVVVPLDATPEEVARIVTGCQAVLLPGSPADIDPQKYGANRAPATAAPDPLRDNADELLLQDAFNMRKPLLGICYGLQSLNVWRTGTLVQHLAQEPVKHDAGAKVPMAHRISVIENSRLARILANEIKASSAAVPVNSSHHQAVEVVGDGLRIVARCAEDGAIEAIEGTNAGHFVLAVQWHPERGYGSNPVSQAIFKAFVEAARQYSPRPTLATALTETTITRSP